MSPFSLGFLVYRKYARNGNNQNYSHQSYVANVQIVFLLSAIIRFFSLIQMDLLQPSHYLNGGVGSAAAIVGSILGVKIFQRFDDAKLRQMVNILLLLLGIQHILH